MREGWRDGPGSAPSWNLRKVNATAKHTRQLRVARYVYWRRGGKGRQGRRRATYAHETLEGPGLSAGLVPFETLEPVVAPEVGEVEGKELFGGERGGERGWDGTDQGGEDGPEKIASRGTAGH